MVYSNQLILVKYDKFGGFCSFWVFFVFFAKTATNDEKLEIHRKLVETTIFRHFSLLFR